MRDGNAGEWNPFVLPAPHCWLLRAAGPICRRRRRHCRAGLGRQVTGGAGARGERATGAGRDQLAGHFPLPGRAPAGTTSSSPAACGPAPPARLPARLPRPGRTFRVGRTQKKSFAGGAGEGAPGGRDSAPFSDLPGSRDRLFLLVLRGADRPARPRGSAFLSLPWRSSRRPGQAGPRRARSGARRALLAGEAPRRGRSPLPSQRPGAKEGWPRARSSAVTASRVGIHARTRSLGGFAFRRRR